MGDILMNSKLYVGNLSPTVSEADLRLLFSRTGAVTEVHLVLDPTTQQSRGHAFVTMATPELAAAALSALHCCNLGGRYITVTEARPPQEPKGMMSEGFASRTPPPSNSGSRRGGTRQRYRSASRPRSRRG
jgi:RNA recognition motif-containing protein